MSCCKNGVNKLRNCTHTHTHARTHARALARSRACVRTYNGRPAWKKILLLYLDHPHKTAVKNVLNPDLAAALNLQSKRPTKTVATFGHYVTEFIINRSSIEQQRRRVEIVETLNASFKSSSPLTIRGIVNFYK